MNFYLFLIFSNIAIIFGLVLVFFKNPIYSILSLVGCVLSSVFLLLLFNVEFMSFVYLVVYVGAISILFLFVIMMLNVNSVNSLPQKNSSSLLVYVSIFFKSVYSFFFINQSIFLFYLETANSTNTELPLENYTPLIGRLQECPTYPIILQKSFLDKYPNLLVSGLDDSYELAGFCLLYTTFFLYFILGGFILLLALLGSISLCAVK